MNKKEMIKYILEEIEEFPEGEFGVTCTTTDSCKRTRIELDLRLKD